jgi:uncharacterized membrane protein YagU involved in acid resistance
MHLDVRRLALAGVAGTAVMTMVGLWVAPLMGIPAMNPAAMLAMAMGGMLAAGWAAHFMIGIVLAVGYGIVAGHLPGPAPLRGALYALAPWLMAQVVVMPMMGAGLFSGSVVLAAGSMIGHVMYGAVVGAVAGVPGARRVAPAGARA